jgi:hypothetical protein
MADRRTPSVLCPKPAKGARLGGYILRQNMAEPQHRLPMRQNFGAESPVVGFSWIHHTLPSRRSISLPLLHF